MNYEEMFKDYLANRGYAASTADNYPKRLKRIIKEQGITWDILINNIVDYVRDYDVGGPFEEEGNRSHRAYINALKRFQEMIHR